jgi:hypothetical protein
MLKKDITKEQLKVSESDINLSLLKEHLSEANNTLEQKDNENQQDKEEIKNIKEINIDLEDNLERIRTEYKNVKNDKTNNLKLSYE